MKYDLKSHCAQCPFRCDRPPFIRADRAQEITDAVLHKQLDFACHKTLDFDLCDGADEDAGGAITEKTQMCAGAMILAEKLNKPTQMMRIAERFGEYDHKRLRMDSPVFDTQAAMVRHHKRGAR